MTDTPELNVWREASDAASENAVKWKPAAEERAAAVIRTYGDQRYQAAIDDVVAMIGGQFGEQFGLPMVAIVGEMIAHEITQRFGKDA